MVEEFILDSGYKGLEVLWLPPCVSQYISYDSYVTMLTDNENFKL